MPERERASLRDRCRPPLAVVEGEADRSAAEERERISSRAQRQLNFFLLSVSIYVLASSHSAARVLAAADKQQAAGRPPPTAAPPAAAAMLLAARIVDQGGMG